MFTISEQTLHQLEFDSVLKAVAAETQSPASFKKISIPTFLLTAADVLQSMRPIADAHRFLRTVSSLKNADWCDLSEIEPTWQLKKKVIETSDLLVIKKMLSVYVWLFARLKAHQENFPYLWELILFPLPPEPLLKRFDIIFEPDGSISDRASKRLASIRQEIRGYESRIQQRANVLLKLFSESGFLGGQQLTIRGGRLVVPVLAEHKRHVKGFIHDISGTGQTVFIEPQELVDLNNDLQELKSEEKREIHRILAEFSEEVRDQKETILQINENLIQVDGVQAWVSGLNLPVMTIPELSNQFEWKIENGIHPVLYRTKSQKKEQVVPLNLQLGVDGDQFIIISGPNAGGKSVAMKCLGLLQLLVQAGVPVPVNEGSFFPLCDGVFSVMGDSQSIQDDLSSFSGHISSIREVLNQEYKARHLILIDEIASGTDPVEGQALAAEILLELLNAGYAGIVTSHYPDLKILPETDSRVVNGSMLFDLTHLKPTYEFRKGIPGSSYALELAQRMGLNAKLIDRAKNRLSVRDQDSHQLMAKLQIQLSDSARAEQELRSEIRALEETQQKLNHKEQELRQKEKEARSFYKSEFKMVTESLRRQIFNELEQLKKAKHVDFVLAKRALEKTISTAESTLENGTEAIPAPIDFKKGMHVKPAGGSQSGEILEVGSDFLVVQVGTFKMRLAKDQVQLVKEKKVKAVSTVKLPVEEEPARFEINLIGLTVNEALDKLDYAMSDSVFRQLPSLRIIHGKGTGTLRKAVQSYLTKHPDVERFELAQWYEGSTGATIVFFK